MNRPTFDANKPYRALVYVRMSSDKQNERSTQQQDDQIRAVIESRGLNWTVVEV